MKASDFFSVRIALLNHILIAPCPKLLW